MLVLLAMSSFGQNAQEQRLRVCFAIPQNVFIANRRSALARRRVEQLEHCAALLGRDREERPDMPPGDHQAMAGRNRIGVADPDGERVLAEDVVGGQCAEWTGWVGQGAHRTDPTLLRGDLMRVGQSPSIPFSGDHTTITPGLIRSGFLEQGQAVAEKCMRVLLVCAGYICTAFIG